MQPIAGSDLLQHLTAWAAMPLFSHAPGEPVAAEVRACADDRQRIPARCTRHAVAAGAGRGQAVETRVVIVNDSDRPMNVLVHFTVALCPTAAYGAMRGLLPLSALGGINHPATGDLGRDQRVDPDVFLGCPFQNNGEVRCHYLEPGGIDPDQRTTDAPLLIPMVTWGQPMESARLSLMGSPLRPWRFVWTGSVHGLPRWVATTRVRIPPRSRHTERCWLFAHGPSPRAAWRAFHELVVDDAPAPPKWLSNVRVNYYDFLSAARPGARRGDGFDADADHFAEMAVGMATQHGYYSHWGDYIHPDRPIWLAMRGDGAGPTEMSLAVMRRRIERTRLAGARASVYLHLTGLDEAAPIFDELRDAVRMGADGERCASYWTGPDVEQTAWQMSIAAPAWRDHLLQQARWIMELLDPDALTVDETFCGLGYDYHPDRRGCLSVAMIPFIQELRALVRSYGEDKAVLTSDCAMAPFALWADGEAGDHAYPGLLGAESYRREPICYTAVLNGKAWIPGAWQFVHLWDEQLELMRKAGAAVGVSNGWIEYTGLAGLPAPLRRRLRQSIDPPTKAASVDVSELDALEVAASASDPKPR